MIVQLYQYAMLNYDMTLQNSRLTNKTQPATLTSDNQIPSADGKESS